MQPNSSQNGGSTARNPDDLFAIFDDPAPTEQSDTPTKPKETKHTHRKTRSLVGFDPLLDGPEQSKSSSDDRGWSNDDSSHHPLLSSASSKNTKRKPPAHRSSKSVCVSELQDIASQLSHARPRALTSDEQRSITLGDSTKDSISKHDQKLLKKKSHRKSHSVSDIIGLRPPTKVSPPPTPATRGKPLVKAPVTSNTPPRSASTTPIQSPMLTRTSIASKLSTHRKTSPVPQDSLNIPTLMKQSPTSFLKDAAAMAPRSSEQDPSLFQVAFPTSTELLVHAKLCALLDSYRTMDQNFDFNVLKGVDPLSLKRFVTLDSSNHGIAGLATEQKPVVEALLKCADDMRVEGFFTSGQDEDRLEVGVFSQQNTFIVVYRGTPEQQLKPARTKVAPVNLDQENPVAVYPPFRDAYFTLETEVYGLLDTLVEENPFSDVVFVGHSFGGGLATIGAVRFASARPMLRFSCHAFGSPKVGTQEFRQMVNSLSNLKVMRVEYGNDVNCSHPSDVGSATKYDHVGHSLSIHQSVGANNHKTPSHPVLAYRFDHKKPTMNRLQMRKQDIRAYVQALEPFAAKKLEWISLYVGQDVGKGVRGKNNEKRLMV